MITSENSKTTVEVINALKDIAENENADFAELWENGYTDKLSENQIIARILLHILKNNDLNDLKTEYAWGNNTITFLDKESILDTINTKCWSDQQCNANYNVGIFITGKYEILHGNAWIEDADTNPYFFGYCNAFYTSEDKESNNRNGKWIEVNGNLFLSDDYNSTDTFSNAILNEVFKKMLEKYKEKLAGI